MFYNQLKGLQPSFSTPDGAYTEDIENFSLTSFDTSGRVFEGATIVYNPDNGTFSGVNGMPNQTSITLALKDASGNFEDISIDFSKTTMYDKKGTSTLEATSGDAGALAQDVKAVK